MPLVPKSKPLRLGILGGGQLAGMMLPYAKSLGIETAVLDVTNAPAGQRADQFVSGDFTNADDVLRFAADCDIVTIEIEKVSTGALAELEKSGKLVRPSAQVVATVQDKGLQKQFFRKHNIPTAEFVLTESARDLRAHFGFLPAAHKLRVGGYDGRGVVLLRTGQDLVCAFNAPAVLEKLVDFTMEISVIVARGVDGVTAAYAPVEMVLDPKLNLLDYLVSPANISEALATEAEALAIEVAEKLGVVGLLAVEMFVTKQGTLLVNEVAPRPHNSGHHTIEAAKTSQSEQHLRAVSGLPLGDPLQQGFALLLNLVGEPAETGKPHFVGAAEAGKIPGVHVHEYGKVETRPGRKMGHVTILGKSRAEVEDKAKRVRSLVRVVAEK